MTTDEISSKAMLLTGSFHRPVRWLVFTFHPTSQLSALTIRANKDNYLWHQSLFIQEFRRRYKVEDTCMEGHGSCTCKGCTSCQASSAASDRNTRYTRALADRKFQHTAARTGTTCERTPRIRTAYSSHFSHEFLEAHIAWFCQMAEPIDHPCSKQVRRLFPMNVHQVDKSGLDSSFHKLVHTPLHKDRILMVAYNRSQASSAQHCTTYRSDSDISDSTFYCDNLCWLAAQHNVSLSRRTRNFDDLYDVFLWKRKRKDCQRD